MDFNDVVPCKNKSAGTNTCEFIIIHHTGGGSYESNVRILSGNSSSQVSCHFVIGRKGEVAKIGDPKEIQWHAGVSDWGDKENMNRYSIGIEIVDDPKQGQGKDRFTDEQRKKVRELVQYLMKAYKIPVENILTHASLTRVGSKQKILWDGVTKSRKVDADRSLWTHEGYNTFAEYRASFIAQSDTVTPTQKRLFGEIMKANSNGWHVGDAEDRARLSEINNYFRNKYKL